MAVVNGPYFMSYTDNGESPLTDPDQPSTSYEPTLTNVSTEVVTPIKISTEGPKTKEKKVTNITVVATGSRLPEPCPLSILSERTKEIVSNVIKGNDRFFLLREAVKGICPHPSGEEYTVMAKTLCHAYPELKDKGDEYWVSVHVCNYVTM